MMHIWVQRSRIRPNDEGIPEHLCRIVPTVTEAKAEIRSLLQSEHPPHGITVHLTAGLYRPEEFVFTAEDSSPDCPVIYQADPGAVLHGGLTVPREEWLDPDRAMAVRFPEEIRHKVKMADLTAYGYTPDDWGEMQTIGVFSTDRKYTDVQPGNSCEAFCGERRMTLARYPNEGYLQLDAVADVGDCAEFPPQNYYDSWGERKDHRGGTYILDRETNAHIRRWADDDTAWMFGYFYWDWADSSTPIRLDKEHRRVFTKYVSQHGARKGANYYLYNVPEELDSEGEWYLDRKTGKMYFWPDEEADSVDFYCRDTSLIICTDTCNMTFSGLTLCCTTGDAVRCSGKGMTFSGLLVKNIGGSGMDIRGSDNLVENCEVIHAGKGGVYLYGGDRKTLTPGNNRVTNCLIHHFGEVYQTYQPGVRLNGVGNRCDHCEICHAPHSAIQYSGNELLIEYNDIHDVVLLSSDAGAIYAGQSWTACGNVIRYNYLHQIGAGEFRPDGVYWDDGLSGQTAYSNIIVEAKKHGFLLGGGRENTVERNLIIHCGDAIEYDDRYREGLLRDGWAQRGILDRDGGIWKTLREVPYDTGIWAEKYPRLKDIIWDFDRHDEPDFPANPAYGRVRDNVIIHAEENLGILVEAVRQYSEVENNLLFRTAAAAGLDPETMTLSPDSPVYQTIPDWENIPLEKIGRNKA